MAKKNKSKHTKADETGSLELIKTREDAQAFSPEEPRVSTEAALVAPQDSFDTISGEMSEEDIETQLAYEHLARMRNKRKRKRMIGMGIAAVLLLGVGGYAAAKLTAPSQDQEYIPSTSMVYTGDFITSVNSSGSTQPAETVVVTPEVEGIIETLNVVEGQTVNKGDVLFTLKNEDLDRAVKEAEQAVSAAYNGVNAAQRSVDAAWNSYTSAWNACNATGDWSSFDEVGLQGAYDAAVAELESSRVAASNAEEVLEQARVNADKRNVSAPSSGTIVAMNAQLGADVSHVVSEGKPLVQISNLSTMKVTVQVNEVDISQLEVGQTGVATFPALPDVQLDCQITRIASVAGSGSDYYEGGNVNYDVDLLIPHPHPDLKPGMTASVEIVTQNVPDTIIVPASAIYRDGDKSYVSLVVDEESYETQAIEVTVLATDMTETAVAGQLKDGDMVLLSGGALDAGDTYEGDDAGMYVEFEGIEG